MTAAELPPLWYLDGATVERHLPALPDALDLARDVLVELARPGREPQVKAVLRPGDGGVFAQALPARSSGSSGSSGGARPATLGMKWIAGSGGNRAAGLPALGALVVLNDPATGMPLAILDGAAITAARTAALSGAALRIVAGTRPMATALVLGAGVQGTAHLDVLAACGVRHAWLHDRHPERSQAVAERDRSDDLEVTPIADPRAVAASAGVIVSATALGGSVPWLTAADVSADAVVLPVDYAAQVTPDLVRAATTFAVDDRAMFEEHRAGGRLAGWPDPTRALGADSDPPARSSKGIAVALHQGPGLADVWFADAVLRSARAAGEGMPLPR